MFPHSECFWAQENEYPWFSLTTEEMQTNTHVHTQAIQMHSQIQTQVMECNTCCHPFHLDSMNINDLKKKGKIKY